MLHLTSAGQNGGSASVLPDFHLSLRVMLSVDVARGRVRKPTVTDLREGWLGYWPK